DGSVGDQWYARGRGHRVVDDLEIRHGELRLHRLHDLLAQVEGEPDRLQLVIEIGQGQRAVAVPDRDSAGLLDLLERTVEALRLGRRRAEQADGHDDCGCCLHAGPPALSHWGALELRPDALSYAEIGYRLSGWSNRPGRNKSRPPSFA